MNRELGFVEEAREKACREAFDRWLAAHDAEVRASAIREAAEFIQPWNYDRPDDWTEIARAEASSADALRVLAAGVVAEEPGQPKAAGWSAEDRRAALGEAAGRWAVQDNHDRITRRDQDLYAMGARQGFALGAEWWKASHLAPEPQGEPSDARVQAALDALSRFNQWTENPRGAMRAALRAAWGAR